MRIVIIRILFICITSVSLNVIYNVFFTYEKFNGNPVLFFPHINYPIFVILSFVSSFIFEKYIMKSKMIWTIAFALIVTLSFIFLAKSIEHKYGYVYEHYYQRTPFTNLTHLKEYRNELDNRLTLGKALKNQGIKVESIQGGYTEKGHLANSPKDYRKKVYYVNDDLYIIFDWDERKITAQEDTQSIRQKIFMTSEKTPKDNDIRFSHSAYKVSMQDEHGMTTIKRYVIEPAEDGTFEFIQTH